MLSIKKEKVIEYYMYETHTISESIKLFEKKYNKTFNEF